MQKVSNINMDKKEFAENKLRELGVLTVDMSEAFNRGNVDELLYASDKAIFIRHKGGMHMLWCSDADEGIRALSCAVGCENDNTMHCCIAHGKAALDAINAVTDFTYVEACVQYCRYSRERIPLRGICDIRPLNVSDAPTVVERYHMIHDLAEAQDVIEKGLMYGAEVDGTLAGFIGWHSDGSAGMLEVFPEFRRRGLGVELECFMHNLHIERGWIPYGQVYVSNDASHKLQEKISLDVSQEYIWWTSNKKDN